MTSALIVIDMQNDFCQPSSPLFVAGAPGIFANVERVVESFRAAGLPIVWVLRANRPDGIDTDRSRRDLFARSPFLVSAPGASLVDGLAISEREYVITKRRWSAFFATDLDLLLRRLSVTRLYLSGVQTPNCIRATACVANALDYECVVLSDATASANDAVQAANLYDMRNMGIQVLSTTEAVATVGQAELVSVP